MRVPEPLSQELAEAAKPFFDQAWIAADELAHSDLEIVEKIVSSFGSDLAPCGDVHKRALYLLNYIQDYVCDRRYAKLLDQNPDADREIERFSLIFAVKKLIFLRLSAQDVYESMKLDGSLTEFCEEVGQTAAEAYVTTRERIISLTKFPDDFNARINAYASADLVADDYVTADIICARF